MNTQIKPYNKYVVKNLKPGSRQHGFREGDIVIALGMSDISIPERPAYIFERISDCFKQHLFIDEVQGYDKQTLPTWCDLVPVERHQLLGELIDAMIYSGIATAEVQSLVEKFRKAGYVRSVILPAATVIDEPSKS